MLLVAVWMDLEIIILSAINQTEKVIYHMILLICRIKKNVMQMNLFTNRLTDLENKLMVTSGVGLGEGIKMQCPSMGKNRKNNGKVLFWKGLINQAF